MKCNKQYEYISKISNSSHLDFVSKVNPRSTDLSIIKQLPRCRTFFQGTLTNRNLEYMYYSFRLQPKYLAQYVYPFGNYSNYW